MCGYPPPSCDYGHLNENYKPYCDSLKKYCEDVELEDCRFLLENPLEVV